MTNRSFPNRAAGAHRGGQTRQDGPTRQALAWVAGTGGKMAVGVGRVLGAMVRVLITIMIDVLTVAFFVSPPLQGRARVGAMLLIIQIALVVLWWRAITKWLHRRAFRRQARRAARIEAKATRPGLVTQIWRTVSPIAHLTQAIEERRAATAARSGGRARTRPGQTGPAQGKNARRGGGR